MLASIVEVIACHKLSYHLVAAISQSVLTLVSHSRLIEDFLLAAPSCRQAIADTWVGIEVEALLCGVVDDLW